MAVHRRQRQYSHHNAGDFQGRAGRQALHPVTESFSVSRPSQCPTPSPSRSHMSAMGSEVALESVPCLGHGTGLGLVRTVHPHFFLPGWDNGMECPGEGPPG